MLDRDGALHLDDRGDYGPWPEAGSGEIALPVDFEGLTPDHETALDNRRGIRLTRAVVQRVLEWDGGLRGRDNAVPPLDVLGWYQPIHFFAGNWGTFIRESALVDLAADLAPRFQHFADRRSAEAHVALLLRAAFVFIYLHEQYHHKIESLAIRLHVAERRPVYPDFKLNVAKVVAGTDDDLQEALANADAWRRLGQVPYSSWFAADERQVIREWLEDVFIHSPPGYSQAVWFLSATPFDGTEQFLSAQVQEARVVPRRPHPEDFGIATHLTQALFNLKQNVWTLVPAGEEPILPTISGVFPLATARLERYIKRQGWKEVSGAGKGSHTKYRHEGQMIILPHSKDVSLRVLSSAAHTLGYKIHDLIELAS
jgi:predicted RNA binding protein YcfA (HicA-like mRNA interferase family)